MVDPIEIVRNFIVRNLWRVDVAAASRKKAVLIRLLRHFYIIVRGLAEPRLSLRAASLVYTTLLSIVPLLAVGFSVLKAFGVQNQIEPFLYGYLSPLGPKGGEIASRIISYVNNIRAGVLGTVGLGFLIYTVISAAQKVEEAFNTIWGVSQQRDILRKFRDYLSIVVIGPVLLVIVLGLSASFMSTSLGHRILVFGPLVYLMTKLIPYLFIAAIFTFSYSFFPNTNVNFTAALTGGLFGGALWELAGWGFASFVVTSSRYPAIYSTFAILILAFIWIYVSWLVLLIGAEIAFFHQYPRSVIPGWEILPLGNGPREKMALLIMYFVGSSFYHNKKPWTLDRLVRWTGVYIEHVRELVTVLERNGLLRETRDAPPFFQPGRALDTISLADIVHAVRSGYEEAPFWEKPPPMKVIDDLVVKIDGATVDALAGQTLKDFVASGQSDQL
ncbi:MAG: YhjD/YihY/BrkB family envelope integrity protein [Deltaproteobacteria bacterium]